MLRRLPTLWLIDVPLARKNRRSWMTFRFNMAIWRYRGQHDKFGMAKLFIPDGKVYNRPSTPLPRVFNNFPRPCAGLYILPIGIWRARVSRSPGSVVPILTRSYVYTSYGFAMPTECFPEFITACDCRSVSKILSNWTSKGFPLNLTWMTSQFLMGLVALVCRHDIPLFLARVDTLGDQRRYAFALSH